MFQRAVKKQFNESKYNLLTKKGAYQITHQQKRPFQKQLVGTVALSVLGFNVTKRYCTFPHYHKDLDHPVTLANGELHPFDYQPAVSTLPALTRFQRSHIWLTFYFFDSLLVACKLITSTSSCTEQFRYPKNTR